MIETITRTPETIEELTQLHPDYTEVWTREDINGFDFYYAKYKPTGDSYCWPMHADNHSPTSLARVVKQMHDWLLEQRFNTPAYAVETDPTGPGQHYTSDPNWRQTFKPGEPARADFEHPKPDNSVFIKDGSGLRPLVKGYVGSPEWTGGYDPLKGERIDSIKLTLNAPALDPEPEPERLITKDELMEMFRNGSGEERDGLARADIYRRIVELETDFYKLRQRVKELEEDDSQAEHDLRSEMGALWTQLDVKRKVCDDRFRDHMDHHAKASANESDLIERYEELIARLYNLAQTHPDFVYLPSHDKVTARRLYEEAQ